MHSEGGNGVRGKKGNGPTTMAVKWNPVRDRYIRQRGQVTMEDLRRSSPLRMDLRWY